MPVRYVTYKATPKPGTPDTVAGCVWGDHSTVGAVIASDGAETVPLDRAAEKASALRDEIRVRPA